MSDILDGLRTLAGCSSFSDFSTAPVAHRLKMSFGNLRSQLDSTTRRELHHMITKLTSQGLRNSVLSTLDRILCALFLTQLVKPRVLQSLSAGVPQKQQLHHRVSGPCKMSGLGANDCSKRCLHVKQSRSRYRLFAEQQLQMRDMVPWVPIVASIVLHRLSWPFHLAPCTARPPLVVN